MLQVIVLTPVGAVTILALAIQASQATDYRAKTSMSVQPTNLPAMISIGLSCTLQ